MNTLVVFLAFLALSSVALAQEQQYDAQQYAAYIQQYAQQLANSNQGGVSPQWFLPLPPFLPPHLPFGPLPNLPALPPLPSFPHPSKPAPATPSKPPPASPSKPPPASPSKSPPSSSSSPPPALPDLSPCLNDLHSFFTSHQIAISSGCCSALGNVQIPIVKALVAQQCSSSKAPPSN